jgi:hypothetical protein
MLLGKMLEASENHLNAIRLGGPMQKFQIGACWGRATEVQLLGGSDRKPEKHQKMSYE